MKEEFENDFAQCSLCKKVFTENIQLRKHLSTAECLTKPKNPVIPAETKKVRLLIWKKRKLCN